jgi:hypothetical protein
MSGLLYLAELSRHSWPPRNRTAQYLRIRQAPSTSWVVASRWRRSRPQDVHTPHPVSSRRLPPGRFTIHEQRAERSKPRHLPDAPSAFGAVPTALAGSLSRIVTSF